MNYLLAPLLNTLLTIGGGIGMVILFLWITFSPEIKEQDWFKAILPKWQTKTWFKFVATNCDAIMTGRFLEAQKRYVGVYRGCDIVFDMDEEYSHLYLRRSDKALQNAASQSSVLTAPFTPDKMVNYLVPHGLPEIKGQLTIEREGRALLYKEDHLLKSEKHLKQVCDLLSDLAHNYPALLTLGGEVMPALQHIFNTTENYILTKVAVRLAIDIANKTTAKFEGETDRWLCPNCLTRCVQQPIKFPGGKSASYYGCRFCHQSRNLLNGIVVMRLDKTATHPVEATDEAIYLNWSVDQRLADFSRVHIMQANDAEVEHFAVHIGNDTDPFRKKLYKQVTCYISPECNLSPGTVRILQEFLGDVTIH